MKLLKRIEKLQSDQRGFSMIELLTIVGIMGVVITIAGFALGLPTSTQAKRTVLSIDTLLSRTKAASLAKDGDVYMRVYNDDGAIRVDFYEDDKWKEGEEVAAKGKEVTVSYILNNTGTAQKLNVGESIFFGFDRRTNGFLYTTDAADLACTCSSGPTTHASNCRINGAISVGTYDFTTKLIIVGGSVSYDIDLGRVTGTSTKYIQ